MSSGIGRRGGHADVFVAGDCAFIVYFTHPDPNDRPRSAVQMAELKIKDGPLACDRNGTLNST